MTAIALMTEEEVAGYGRRDDMGFGALRTERGLLPLAAMDVDARIAGVFASVEVAQTFVNTTRTAIEATYIFPLPDRAAVSRFRMEVAGRVIEGVVNERGVAREQYEEAIAQGHRAAITEEERPGVFTLRVGNLMPGESATVRLTLVGPLPVDDGEVTFRFPLVVAPRYMPGHDLGGEQAGLGTAADTTSVPDASRISPPRLLPGCPNPVRLGIRVAIADHVVRDVASSLHAVTTSHQDALVVELGGSERLDRDFLLRWRIDGDSLQSSLVCCDDDEGGTGTFMLTMVPPSTLSVSQKPRDIVFVIDRSGSMDGWKMLAARRACARMIDTLTSRDRFHVIAFDNVVEVLPESRLTSATDRTRYRAVEELAKVAARGGTELAMPLQLAARALAGGHDDRERVIVLITDGQVGNEDQILHDITPMLRGIRVFTLGIDQAVNAGFLKRFASAGGGLCELVESEDRLDDVMAKVHRRIGTPVASELRIEANGLEVEWTSISPSRLPDVYAGAPVTVFGRYKGAAPATASLGITGTTYGDPLRLDITRDASATAMPAIAASWARARIRDLEDTYALGDHSVEPEIVRISRRFNVLSRFTAYLAIDRSAVVNPGGGLVQVVQPVEEPAGWSASAAASPVVHSVAPMSSSARMPLAMPAPSPRAAPATPMGAPPPIYSRPPQPTEAAPSAPMAMSPPPLRAQREIGDMPGAPAAARRSSAAASPARPLPPAPPPMPSRPRQDDLSDPSVYLANLEVLTRDLVKHAANASALRLVRERLKQWVEDVRSVGGHDALADAVTELVQRLTNALSANTSVEREVGEIADALLQIAGGGPLPPRRSGRGAFWK